MSHDPNQRAMNRDRFVHEDDERPLRDRFSDDECARGDYEYDLQRDNDLIAKLESNDKP
jgi:hypothetical protein